MEVCHRMVLCIKINESHTVEPPVVTTSPRDHPKIPNVSKSNYYEDVIDQLSNKHNLTHVKLKSKKKFRPEFHTLLKVRG